MSQDANPEAPHGAPTEVPNEGAPGPDASGDTEDVSGDLDDAGKKPSKYPGVDMSKAYKPPSHVETGHVYSNAYRKAKAAQKTQEDAKADGRLASKIFQDTGLVTPCLNGRFRPAPRPKKAEASPKDVPADGNEGKAEASPEDVPAADENQGEKTP